MEIASSVNVDWGSPWGQGERGHATVPTWTEPGGRQVAQVQGVLLKLNGHLLV